MPKLIFNRRYFCLEKSTKIIHFDEYYITQDLCHQTAQRLHGKIIIAFSLAINKAFPKMEFRKCLYWLFPLDATFIMKFLRDVNS